MRFDRLWIEFARARNRARYQSGRREKIGYDSRDYRIGKPKRRVKNKSSSVLDYTPYKSNFRSRRD